MVVNLEIEFGMKVSLSQDFYHCIAVVTIICLMSSVARTPGLTF